MAGHDLSILDSVSTTVNSSADKPKTSVTDNVSASVSFPVFVARLFDEDKLNKRMKGNYKRFELLLSEDEIQAIDPIAKEFDAGHASVLRVGLRMLLRKFDELNESDS